MTLTTPSDALIERSALSCVFSNIDAANYICTSLKEEDFYDIKNKIIFEEARKLYMNNEMVDISLISSSLAKSEKMNLAGGINYLLQVAQCFTPSADYEGFVEELKNVSNLRKLLSLSQRLAHDSCKFDASSEKIISDIQKKLYDIQGLENKRTRSVKDILQCFSENGTFDQHLQWMVERAAQGLPCYDGVSSGYPILDGIFGFFRRSAIYYIGARTSMGKTTFMLNLIKNMLQKKYSVGVFSLEMPADLITAKLLALYADTKFSLYEDGKLSGEQQERFTCCAETLMNSTFIVDDQEGITISQLASRARRMRDNFKIDVLFIDYLTRIKSNIKYPSKHLQVDEISKSLQTLARELKIPIICLAQLNRQAASRNDHKPTLADFRESGSIEEDADGCILLHRPDYYDTYEKVGEIHVIVAKNRIRGNLRTLKFTKNGDSEIYQEAEDLGKLIQKLNNHGPQECVL